MKAIILASV